MADLARLSIEDLEAIASGDMSKVSDAGLQMIAGDAVPPAPTSKVDFSKVEAPGFVDKAALAADKVLTQLGGAFPDFLPSRDTLVRTASSASGTMRGGLNIPKRLGLTDTGYGDIAFPKQGENIVGSVLDPVALAIGGGATKLSQLAPYLGPIGKGMLGGSSGSAAIAGVSGEGDIESAAGFGGLLGGFFPGAAKVYAGAKDWISGNKAKLRAADIVRATYGDKLPQAQRLWESAPDTVTASQAAAPTRSVLGAALGERARSMNAQPVQDVLETQAAARNAEMVKWAKGGSAEETAIARDFMRKQGEAQFGPERTRLLTELAKPGREAQDLLAQLSDAEKAYVTALRRQGVFQTEASQAGRIQPAGTRIEPNPNPVSMQGERVPSVVRTPTAAQPPDFAAQRAYTKEAQEAALTAQQARVEADAIRAKIGSPFSAANARQTVDQMIEGSVNPSRTAALKAVRDALANAGDDPFAVYNVRKLGVNELIGDLVQSGKISRKDAMAAVTEVRNSIDNSLGPDFKQRYLSPMSKRLQYLDSLDLMDKLRAMQKSDPANFVKTIQGENPELLAQYAKGSTKTLQEIIGDRRFGSLQRISGELERDAQLLRDAGIGSDQMTQILSNKAAKFRFFNMLDAKVTMANKVLSVMENSLDKKTMTELYKALESGKKTSELLKVIPAEDRSAVLNAIYTSKYSAPLMSGSAALSGETK